MVQIVGKYLYESGENFDAFLKALDVGFILRNLAKTSKPTIEITLDGDVYTIKTITTLKTTEIKFKLGEEFEETRMDGKTVKTTITQEGDTLVQIQKGEKEGDKEVKIIREFTDTHLKTICSIGDITSTRVYKRA